MIEELKKTFYNFLTSLGYEVTDSGVFAANMPSIQLRVKTASTTFHYDAIQLSAIFALDVFSAYSGEKEILTIVDNINNNLLSFIKEHSEITSLKQAGCLIVDDTERGTIKKHGIINYEFVNTYNYNTEQEE